MKRVGPTSLPRIYDPIVMAADGSDEARRAARRGLGLAQVFDANVDVRSVVERTASFKGTAAGVRQYVDENEIDHVVIGCHGRDGVARWVLGSVAETVVRRAPAPVTAVK